MKPSLTARAVESIKPDPLRRLEIPDTLLPGLYLLVQPTGRKGWAVRYRFGGKPCKLTLGAYPVLSLADARELARAALQNVAKGADPVEQKRRATAALVKDSVLDVGAEFLKRHASKNRSAAETERIFKREVWPAWGERSIADVSRRDVIALVDRVIDRGSPIMANRVLATVRKFFAWAVSRDIIAASPAAGVKPPSAETKRERILSDDEIRWFWRGCDQLGWPFGPACKLLLLTAQRRDEVGEMAFREIDGKVWTIPASRAKNGRTHQITLPDAALQIIETLPRVRGKAGLVFTTNGETPASGYSRAKQRLDALMLDQAREEAKGRGLDPTEVRIPHWTLHDLRRTAASGMARIGVQLPVIERVLNHVSGSFGGVVGVYQRHSFAAEMASALSEWANFVQDVGAKK